MRAASPGSEAPLALRYRAVRVATERLAEPLSAEDCALQSMPDASPTKWHLAHTSWYFETFVLEGAIAGYRPFDPDYRVLFNSYYNAVGAQYARPHRGLLSRPSLESVMAYRAHVDRHVETLLDKDFDLDEDVRFVIMLGTHHEQQHQELLLTDLKHLLAMNPTHPAYRPLEAPPERAAPALDWIRYEEGLRRIGHDDAGFAFDNEQPAHRSFVAAFDLGSRPVTNGEYLAFVQAGGYGEPSHWLSDGWATLQAQGWRAPLYWEETDTGWQVQTLGGLRVLNLDEPVCHVSYYEADAYARAAGCRLPTEAEWEVAAAPEPVRGNFVEADLLHPAPAGAGDGLQQLYGDVWEWTQSPYVPYPGFRPAAGALGEYNGKFMSNQLVLRGGSCATPTSQIRPSYRNFFYPDARWQFSGIRLAQDAT
jgi:ergothioneine biosynthesis protein EgtB